VVVGASGAGKSSFLNVIMGQERVDSGTVIVGPYNLTKIKKKELPYLRRMLGIVFQDFRLIPKMTVYDNVAFALRVIGLGERIIRKRVRYVLKLVDLSAKAKNLPNQLSTGERQRVAIARALVNNPSYIIADEPTGNLDPVLSGEIMSLFDKINALGATVVVVTHDLELVHQFDHRIVTIESGKIVSDMPSRAEQKKLKAEALAAQVREKQAQEAAEKRFAEMKAAMAAQEAAQTLETSQTVETFDAEFAEEAPLPDFDLPAEAAPAEAFLPPEELPVPDETEEKAGDDNG
ncbi:MAG: ATP-binding cassette domain-containing protein, partial [Clostridia bacterium]|nr:ATP-binding cassette domain-containing protein [Clostridia bacterium]